MITAAYILVFVAGGLLLHAIRMDMRRRRKPDHQLIHRLEYELGFRADPPAMTPEWWADTINGLSTSKEWR